MSDEKLREALAAQIDEVLRLRSIDTEAYEGESGLLLPKLREQLNAPRSDEGAVAWQTRFLKDGKPIDEWGNVSTVRPLWPHEGEDWECRPLYAAPPMSDCPQCGRPGHIQCSRADCPCPPAPPKGEAVCTTCGKRRDENMFCFNAFHVAPKGWIP